MTEYKRVPVEPTEEMIIAGCNHANMGDMAGRYKAMLAAAPPQPESECICPKCGLRHGTTNRDGGF